MIGLEKILASVFFTAAFFAAIIFGAATPSFAQNQTSQTPIQFSILRDAPQDARINDICCGALNAEFKPSENSKFSTGFGDPPIWLLFKKLPSSGILDLGAMVDNVTIYKRDATTAKFSTSQAGDILPLSKRELLVPHIVFPIDAKEANNEIFIKIDHPKKLSISPMFFTVEAFGKNQQPALNIHLILISAVMMMIAFNLLLGILITQPVFIFNAGIAFCLTIINLCFTGLGPAYIWGEWAWASNAIFELTVLIGTTFGAMFVYTFLRDTGQQSIKVRSLLVIPILALATFVCWLILPIWMTQIIQIILTAGTLVFILFILIKLGLRGYRSAIWMLPAMLFAIIPGITLLLVYRYFSVEPLISSQHLIEITLVVEALYFSLLLAFRIRMAEKNANDAFGELNLVNANARRNLIEAVDIERKRIGADLHDSAGQGLMAISNRLDQLLMDKKLSRQQSHEIKKTADYSRNVVGDIRRISHDLYPAAVDHLGWREAVREIFHTLSETSDIQVTLDLDLPGNLLNATQKLYIFRIVQEAVSNISRHSSAQHCHGRFWQENQNLYAEIRDDGAWHSETNTPSPSSIGHVIIDERIATLCGFWSIERIDRETIIHFKFPISKPV